MIKISLTNGKRFIWEDRDELNIELYTNGINIDEELNRILQCLEGNSNGNIGIHKLYMYKEIEMYNFHRGTFVKKLSDIIYTILFIDSVVESFKEEEIIIETDDDIIEYIAIEMFNKRVEKKDKINNSNKKDSFVKVKLITRNIIGICNIISNIINRKSKVLAITQAVDISKINISNKEIYYDSQYGKLIDTLKKEIKVVKLQYLNNIDILNKSINLGRKFIPFELFIVIKKIVSKNFIEKGKISNNLNSLKDIKIYIKGIDATKVISKYLFSELESSYISYIEEIVAAEYLLKLFKIEYVIATNEADRPRCFITAANYKGIKSFGIQHGIITNVSSSYLVPTTDKKLVPDTTFLWGDVSKDQLLDNTEVYCDDNLQVVGQLRTDYLIDKKKKYVDNNNDDKRLKIMFATQPIDDLIKESTKMLFEALKPLGGYQLLIKLHPNDNNESFYKKCADEYNIHNLEIGKDKDLYDCILESDCIITVHSTVVLEGAILKKPSICILLNNYYDQGNFVKDGLAVGAESSEKLKNILQNRLFKINDQYVENNISKVDGNVYKRIIDEMKIYK